MSLLLLLKPYVAPTVVGGQNESVGAVETFWASRTVSVPPDAVISSSGVTIVVADVDESPDSPDASWAVGTGPVDATVGFALPGGTLTDAPGATMQVRIRLRPGS